MFINGLIASLPSPVFAPSDTTTNTPDSAAPPEPRAPEGDDLDRSLNEAFDKSDHPEHRDPDDRRDEDPDVDDADDIEEIPDEQPDEKPAKKREPKAEEEDEGEEDEPDEDSEPDDDEEDDEEEPDAEEGDDSEDEDDADEDDDEDDEDEEAPKADKYSEPPKGIHEKAQREWMNAPKSVRAEVHRRFEELENGITEYQERWADIEPFDRLAKQHGTTVPDALRRYIGFEQAIRNDPIKGLRLAAQDLGVNFDQVVRQVAGLPRDQEIERAQARAAHFENLTNDMVREVKSVVDRLTVAEVDQFAKAHPRFDELAEKIAGLLTSGTAATLDDAYSMAERLFPAPASKTPPAAQNRAKREAAPSPKPADQPRKEKPKSKQISGKHAAKREEKAPSSIDKAITRAAKKMKF